MDSSLGQYGVVYYLNTMSDILSSPIFWIIVTAASEIIGMMPQFKSNSILQLLLKGLLSLKPKAK